MVSDLQMVVRQSLKKGKEAETANRTLRLLETYLRNYENKAKPTLKKNYKKTLKFSDF